MAKEFFYKRKDDLDRAKYTTKLNDVLISQSHNELFYTGNVSTGAMVLVKEVVESLDTDRTSIWLYSEERDSIVCQQLYIKSENQFYQNIELFEKDFAQYFEALRHDPIIIANNAETHPATSCFLESYLKPLGVKSMLDVPIWYRGSVIGVICIESLTPRVWKKEEVDFAQILSSLYSFAHSVKEANILTQDLKEMEEFIDTAALISKADKNGKITYVNEKFTKVSGWKLDDALGKDHNIVNSGVHSKSFWKSMYKTTVEEKKIWNKVVTNRTKDGILYYVDTFIKAEFNAETGELEGFTSIRQDVTELKRKETEISNRMSAINRSNAVIEFDLNGKIMFTNDLFLRILGYSSQDEVVGKHPSIFVEDKVKHTEEYKNFWARLKEGQFFTGEVIRIKKDKSLIYLQATYNPIIGNDGKPYRVMKIATDITQSYNQQMEIEKKNTYLEHAAKILRHDMHSGINTYIPRGVSSLERRLTEDVIKTLKLDAPLKMLKEGLKHTQKVYKGVYEFTNLVKKDVVLTKTECNVKAILDDYLSSAAYKSQVLLDDNLPTLDVNESLFCTALDNLIRNGLKYNDSNTKMVKIYFEKTRKQFGLSKQYIMVEDNGRGIDQVDFEKLSKPYVRKEGQLEAGSGLGLNICKAILTEHGFEITAQKLECGTKLKIKIK
jgi:PAS domain S-box-containing protein